MPVSVTITADATPPTVNVKLVRSGGAAIDLGPQNAGKVVQFVRDEAMNGAAAADVWQHSIFTRTSETADATGRVEYWGPLGDYRVLVDGTGHSDSGIQAAYAIGRGTVKPLATIAELAALPAQALTVSEPKGAVEFSIITDPPYTHRRTRTYSYLALVLIGPDAMAWGYFRPPQEEFEGPRALIIGEPPPELKPVLHNHYIIENLPAGPYKLYTIADRGAVGAETLGNKPLLEFTLKDGEHLNSGELKVQLASATAEEQAEAQQVEMMNYEGGDVDKIEVFKP